ncbi:TTLL3 isoform 21, partial [Pan troglodytes]
KFDDLDGTHALMSRMVQNETPYFIWTTRRDVLDCRFLSKDQMINHYARAGSFTTKRRGFTVLARMVSIS